MDKQVLFELIDRHLAGKTTELEEAQLRNFLASFQGVDLWDEAKEGRIADLAAEVWEQLRSEIEADGRNEDQPVIRIPVHRIHFLRKAWVRYAAAVILLIGSAATLFILQPWKTQPTEIAHTKPVTDIQPGTNKAYVTLGNGKLVVLDTVKPGQHVGDAVMSADGKLVYDEVNTRVVTTNTVTVPRGGTPRFIELPDHTLVWLNTASSISYPTAFTGNTREVDMKGEVYYEVSKDGRRFYAHTRTDKIEVLGTHFNIRAYDDEPNVQTTLLEGQVKIGNTVLTPGDQYENGNIRKMDAAALQRVMAWKNGIFSYDHVDVQTLMRDLSRWYNVEVKFEGKPTDQRYDGKIGRGLTLKQVLNGLSFTELNYRLETDEHGHNRIVMLP